MNIVSSNPHTRTGKRARAALSAVCLMALGGCDRDMSDLADYVDDVNAKPGQPVAPLLAFELTPGREYSSGGLRDPFAPLFTPDPPDLCAAPDACPPPPPRGNPEELEAYPLDALRMVGLLQSGTQPWGLVRSPDGVIHRVRAGNYVGRNNGKITSISDTGIRLRETVLSGGVWHDREARLAFAGSDTR